MSATNSTSTPTTQEQKAQNFEHNKQNSNGVSIVIPRVWPTWTENDYPKDWPLWRKIKAFFITLGWGFVERVDVTPPGRIPKGRFKTVFVHFRANSWNNRDHMARRVLQTLSKGPSHCVEVTYNEPWFWKVFISSAQKTDEPPRAPVRPKVKFSGESKESVCDTVVNINNLKVDTTCVKAFPPMDTSEDSSLPSTPETEYNLSEQNDEELRGSSADDTCAI